MTVIGVGSVRGAPGVTTAALLVTGALGDRVVLVEADLSGGVLAVRYGLGREPGLTTLAAGGATEPAGWWEHAQDAGGVPVLVGPDAPSSCRALWRRAGDRLAVSLASSDATVIADLGRLGDGTPLLEELSLLVVVVRPIAEHLVALSHHLPALRQHAAQAHVGVVLAGEGEYEANEVAGSLGVDVVGTLPNDVRAAEALRAGGSTFRLARSRLFRAAVGLTATIDAAVASRELVRATR